jgi:hypothetical protein
MYRKCYGSILSSERMPYRKNSNVIANPLLNYALEVEKIATLKTPNLILSVYGVIAVFCVHLLRHSGSFTRYFSILKKCACGY